MTTVKDAAELLSLGELVDIRFLRFSGELHKSVREDFDDDDAEQSLEVEVGHRPGIVEVRASVTIATRTAEYSGSAATQFHFDKELIVPEPVAREFAERVGVMAIYPYLRELVQTSSLRLRQPVVTMPFLRAGEVSLTRTDEEEEVI